MSQPEELNSVLRRIKMKRLVVTIALAIALLTSGAVVTQHSMVGTAYANGGGD